MQKYYANVDIDEGSVLYSYWKKGKSRLRVNLNIDKGASFVFVDLPNSVHGYVLTYKVSLR